MQRFQGLIGVILILGLALIFSNNRRGINLRLVICGILLQKKVAGPFPREEGAVDRNNQIREHAELT